MKFPKLLTDNPNYTPPGLTTGCSTTSTEPWAAYLMTQVCDELKAQPNSGPYGGDGISQNELDNGGLKVITTISLPMEEEMYKAVNENIAQMPQVEGQYGQTEVGLPSWALIGAELQNPSNGQILAEFPGRGEVPGQGTDKSTAVCNDYDCHDNTITAREQVGSSFKPYELSTAVQEGMNVQTSILNSSTYLCIPPADEESLLSAAISASTYDNDPGGSTGCPGPGYAKIENDGGEAIGKAVGPKGDNISESDVQNALAQSSNTAFTDLTHRDGLSNVIAMAKSYGVDTSTTGSGLVNDTQAVPAVGLGEASLTVNEQTQMLATIDDNGTFHQGHIIKSWQLPDEAVQTPNVVTRQVLTAAQDSQVQYAMEATTVDGTAVNAATGLGGRQIIGKTGTTSDEHSGFFIGAIPQYALVVGMFANEQDTANTKDSLSLLGGGGFGGFWPATIWNTFAQAEFAKLPAESFQNPQFSGSLWNMIGTLPKAKPKKTTPKCTVTIHGKSFPVPGKGCPTATPTPTPSNSFPGGGFQSQTATPTPTPTTSSTSTSTASPPASPSTGPSFPGGHTADTAETASGVKAGLAVGGVLAAVLPGSLLWTTASRRRRKRGADRSR
jgi:membrane peptidoglycan carboxypeptidase